MRPPTLHSPSPADDSLDPSLQRLLDGRHHDPFDLLGRHPVEPEDVVVRAFLPRTASASIAETGLALGRIGATDLFEWRGPGQLVPARYRLRIESGDGTLSERFDPYCFPPLLADEDLDRFNAGLHTSAYQFMGSHQITVDGIAGIRFAVWAPEAERVSIVGDFNQWDGRCHPMRVRGSSGVWELFVPGLTTTI
ncbi:MAG: 1,4-alpha-glucan branching enzyme, partial [Pseudomonadota bacterium]|nr:1,4-alpha-glucan branching enzyme [Pseudomonadota bacterium]